VPNWCVGGGGPFGRRAAAWEAIPQPRGKKKKEQVQKNRAGFFWVVVFLCVLFFFGVVFLCGLFFFPAHCVKPPPPLELGSTGCEGEPGNQLGGGGRKKRVNCFFGFFLCCVGVGWGGGPPHPPVIPRGEDYPPPPPPTPPPPAPRGL